MTFDLINRMSRTICQKLLSERAHPSIITRTLTRRLNAPPRHHQSKMLRVDLVGTLLVYTYITPGTVFSVRWKNVKWLLYIIIRILLLKFCSHICRIYINNKINLLPTTFEALENICIFQWTNRVSFFTIRAFFILRNLATTTLCTVETYE